MTEHEKKLIQTGAILEKVFPQARTMTTDELEEYLFSSLRTE